MPAVTREISIVYGSVTVGGSSDDYYFHDLHQIDKSYPVGRIRFTVIVAPQSSAANLKTKCDTLEDEFRKINQALTVTIGGQTMVSWSHSANTGFLSRSTIRKPGSPIDSARCRLYECEVEVQFPADATGKDGLVEYELTVSRPASGFRRVYTLEGAYTAVTGPTAAVAQYEAQVPDEITAIDAALSGTFERIEPEFYKRDDENKRVRFLRTYREIGFNQAEGTLDHAAIRNHEVTVTRKILSIENGPDARSPVDLIVTYDADIDSSQTTSLQSFYEGTIRPYMISLARAAAPAAIWRVDDEPVFDRGRNRISARLTCRGAQTNLMFQTISTTHRFLSGLEFEKVFSGNPYARVLYRGPKDKFRITREKLYTLGAVNVPRPGNGGGGGAGDPFGRGTPFGPGATGGITVQGGGFGSSPFGIGATGGVTVTPPPDGSGGGGGAAGGASFSPGWYELYRESTVDPKRLGDSPETASARIEEHEIFEMYAEPASTGGNFVPAGGGGGGGGGGEVGTSSDFPGGGISAGAGGEIWAGT